MSRLRIIIGPSPSEESCAQLGDEDYARCARVECTAYIGQLRRVYGPEPEGAELKVGWNSHDYGRYAEVECRADESMPEAVEYAYRIEKGCGRWDAQALREIGRRLSGRE